MPLDIAEDICEYLSDQNLKTMRHVNRALSEIASRFLFRTVRLVHPPPPIALSKEQALYVKRVFVTTVEHQQLLRGTMEFQNLRTLVIQSGVFDCEIQPKFQSQTPELMMPNLTHMSLDSYALKSWFSSTRVIGNNFTSAKITWHPRDLKINGRQINLFRSVSQKQ